MNIINLISKPAYAAINNPVLKRNQNADPVSNPQAYFNNVLQTIFSIFFIVAVLYFVWNFVFAGYRMISSQGDSKVAEEARASLTNSLIGLIVVFSIFAILKFVGIVLGIEGLEQLSITWPTL